MTTQPTSTQPRSTQPRSAQPGTGDFLSTQHGSTHCRVCVVTPAAAVDLVLPSHLPVADLLPVILEVCRVHDEMSLGFRIGRVGAPPIGAELSLAAAGVVDGDLLDLRPSSLVVPEPVYDEIADVAAAVAADAGGSRSRINRHVALGTAAAALAAGVGRAWSDPAAHAVTSAVLAIALVTSARLVARRFDGIAGVGLGAGGLAFGAVAAAGFAGPAVPSLAAAGAVVILGCPVVGVLVGRGAWLFTALFVLSTVFVAETVLALTFSWSPVDVAATTVVLIASVLPMVSRWAARLAGLRRPSDADADAPIGGDRLQVLLSSSRRAVALAVGLDSGMACALGAAAVMLVEVGGSWSAALALVGLTVLLLRIRSVDVPARAAALLVPAVAGLVAVVAMLALRLPPAAGGWLPAGAVAVAAAAVTTNIIVARGVGNPAGRRALRVLEGALVLAVVPLAVVAVGAYDLVRHL